MTVAQVTRNFPISTILSTSPWRANRQIAQKLSESRINLQDGRYCRHCSLVLQKNLAEPGSMKNVYNIAMNDTWWLRYAANAMFCSSRSETKGRWREQK